jgi:hypothetical protein
MSALLARDGLTCRPSDKGRFTRAATELWGGLEPFSTDLTRPETHQVIKGYLSMAASGVEPGIFLSGVKRRYLSFSDAKILSGMPDEELATWLDSLAEKGVLSRGIILHCQTCRYAGWYPMEQLSGVYTCARCRTNEQVDSRHWRSPLEGPDIHYEMVEVIYQAIHSNCRPVILGLSKLLARKRQAFDYEAELEVLDAQGRVIAETDIWVLIDGRTVIGEAKSTDRLDPNAAAEETVAKKLSTLARAVTADSAVMVTTAAAGWRETTKRRLNDVFVGSGVSVEWLTVP